MFQITRWLPDLRFSFVGDSGSGPHTLANSISRHATLISRLKLDANLFEPPPEKKKVGPE